MAFSILTAVWLAKVSMRAVSMPEKPSPDRFSEKIKNPDKPGPPLSDITGTLRRLPDCTEDPPSKRDLTTSESVF